MKLLRSIRPRLMLLPLVFGVLVGPAFLRMAPTPAAPHELVGDTVCSNSKDSHVRRPLPDPVRESTGPNCAHCRAPLLNAPLAQVERGSLPPADGTTPPAA